MNRRVILLMLMVSGCERAPDGRAPFDVPDTRSDAAPDVHDATPDRPPRVRQPRVDPRPEGRFTVERAPFGADTGLFNMVLGDCNDDGRLDVVTLSDRGIAQLHVGAHEGITVRFEARTEALPSVSAPAGIFADIDHDGRNDLVLAGVDIVALRGLGACRFDPVPVMIGARSDDRAVQVLATDADLDGRTDLSVTQANAIMAPHRLFLGRGDGSFDEFALRTMSLPIERSKPYYIGFGMFFEDIDDDGAMDLFGLLDQRQAWFSWGTSLRGVGQRRDDDTSMLLSFADAMGLSPIDHDRDGAIEWFLSGIRNRSRLLRYVGGQRLIDDAQEANLGGVGDDFAWGSYAFDADLDGWLDLLVLRQGPEIDARTLPNPGPTDLFFNRHDGVFVELGRQVLDLQIRAKGLTCGPLTDAGPIVCFAMDRSGPVRMVNTLRPQGRQAIVRLRGTVSASDATGARVQVEGVSPPLVYAVGGQCAYGAEHDRALQIALGQSASARLLVRWPSGVVQRGVTVTADAHNVITEPEVVTLSRRVAAANGSDTITVTVAPRMVGATTARIEHTGVGTWLAESTPDAQGRVVRTLRAPLQPGEARMMVTLDGVALRVAPRVVFTSEQP